MVQLLTVTVTSATLYRCLAMNENTLLQTPSSYLLFENVSLEEGKRSRSLVWTLNSVMSIYRLSIHCRISATFGR